MPAMWENYNLTSARLIPVTASSLESPKRRCSTFVNLVDENSWVAGDNGATHDPRRSGTVAAAGVGKAAGALLKRHPPQLGDNSPKMNVAGSVSPGGCGEPHPHPPTRSATAIGFAGKKARFYDQTSTSEKETVRPSTTTAAQEAGALRGRGSDLGVGVDVRVRVGGVGVGAAAKARLYRGYCEQRGGEYQRHGGKETLQRIALLNDTFR